MKRGRQERFPGKNMHYFHCLSWFFKSRPGTRVKKTKIAATIKSITAIFRNLLNIPNKEEKYCIIRYFSKLEVSELF